MNIIETLKRLDRALTGDVVYENTWLNVPQKPERTPSDLLREVIKELEVLDLTKIIIHAFESGYISGHNATEDGLFHDYLTHAAAVKGSAEIVAAVKAQIGFCKEEIDSKFVEEGLRLERERESRRLAAQAGAVTQTFPPPPRIYQSLDPLWKKWGVTPRPGTPGSTRWFHTKNEAEHFLKTGDSSRAIDRQK